MLSIEKFAELCAKHVEKREHFLAYWHPHGFGLLRIDPVKYEEWVVVVEEPNGARTYRAATPEQRDHHIREARKFGRRVAGIETVEKVAKAKKGTVSKMRKIIQQLRKDRRCQPLYVVEYDELGLVTDGGDELYALQSIPIPGGGDPVDT